MRKWIIPVLLAACATGVAMPVSAQSHTTNTKSELRDARKMEKKQAKAQKKYAKAQKKAERQMLKTEKKNTTYHPRPL